jgi:hypothetical protein
MTPWTAALILLTSNAVAFLTPLLTLGCELCRMAMNNELSVQQTVIAGYEQMLHMATARAQLTNARSLTQNLAMFRRIGRRRN